MKTSLKAILTALILSFSLTLAGCGSKTASTPAETPDATSKVQVSEHTVTTDLGDVTIPANPQRIVVLNYALTGYLFNLGLPVIGTTPLNAGSTENSFSDNWAEQAEAANTTLLPWANEGYDLESILALEPDLIIAGGLGFPNMQAQQQYTELTKIAPTVVVSDQLTDWKAQLEFIANDVFEQEETYKQLIDTYEKRVEEVKGKITLPELSLIHI